MLRGKRGPCGARGPPATSMRRIEFDRVLSDLSARIKQPALDEHFRLPRTDQSERGEFRTPAERQLMIEHVRQLQIEAVLQIGADVIGQLRASRTRMQVALD